MLKPNDSCSGLALERMPAAVGGRKPPPKNCPLCGEKIWNIDMTRNLYEALRLYREHIHVVHPAYESWDRKTSILYYVVATVFILGLFLVIFVPASLSLIVFGTGVGVLLIGTPVVFLIKLNGKRKFRESWKQEHASP